MDKIQILVNLGYIFMLAALTVRDILWLRILLVSAQLSLFSYGLITSNTPVAFWNALFFVINSYQVVRLFQQSDRLIYLKNYWIFVKNYLRTCGEENFYISGKWAIFIM